MQDYFHNLKKDREFSKKKVADQIAVYFIYIPIIRTEILKFVNDWNIHPIRKQGKKQNFVIGKPYMLFHHPKTAIRNYNLAITEKQFMGFRNDIEDYDKLPLLIFLINRLLIRPRYKSARISTS
jgi:hypothetical protein